MNEKIVKDIIARLNKIEKAVFSNGPPRTQVPKKEKEFVGATGGIRFLISKGFLDTKRNLSDIRKVLEKNSYNYSIQAAQSALNRLSKPGGPLVSLKEGGKKVYVKRK